MDFLTGVRSHGIRLYTREQIYSGGTVSVSACNLSVLRLLVRHFSLVCLILFAGSVVFAQSAEQDSARPEKEAVESSNEFEHRLGKAFIRDLVHDQAHLWSSPLRLQWSDASWLVPISGVTTGLIETDRSSSREIARKYRNSANQFSNVALAGIGFSAAGMYLIGDHYGNDRQSETGLLSAEAGLNALGINQALKYSFRRELPSANNGEGRFFESGGTSFPSNHSMLAFSMASVIAHEYPGPLTKMLAYGGASAIGLARVAAHQHYLSDVFVGSTLGYLIGTDVYKRHHDPAMDTFGTFASESEPLPADQMSSTYIELDSWIYPAVERLSAMGVFQNEFLGQRPWTRMTVSRLLDGVVSDDLDPSASRLIDSLKRELKRETELQDGGLNKSIQLDEVYSRTQYISGTPLTDSYHFSQTLSNDFGRPYASGWQQITGFQSRAENGRFSFFVRGEYQRSPELPGYNSSVAQVIATQDNTPVANFPGKPAGNVFRLLDTYVSVHLLSEELSVGKQSYWWGPDDSSALSLSNNAEPFYSLRMKTIAPVHIPLLSKLLGPFDHDAFFGKLSGHQYPSQPFMYGQKVNFHPTENLEVGFSRDAVFAGTGPGGAPLTFGNFWKSFSSPTSGTMKSGSIQNTKGVRHGSFDFRYRVPYLRNWLTVYADSLVHDDISPVDAPRHAVWMPGIYLAKVPGVPKLDVHVEGGSSDITAKSEGGRYYYYEAVYKDGYQNKGRLLGSWLGREGTGGQAWVTYWFSPESTLQLGTRTLKVSHYFVPQGLNQVDIFGKLRYGWRNGLSIEGLMQVERWRAPVLADSAKLNVTTQVQLSFRPQNWLLSR